MARWCAVLIFVPYVIEVLKTSEPLEEVWKGILGSSARVAEYITYKIGCHFSSGLIDFSAGVRAKIGFSAGVSNFIIIASKSKTKYLNITNSSRNSYFNIFVCITV
jgi:hypothetical protein